MKIAIIMLIAIFVLAILCLYYRGNAEIKEHIHLVVDTLNDKSLPVPQRIEEAKSLCRNHSGIVPYAMYCIIKTMESINKEKD